MIQPSEIISQAVTQDLFGPDGLTEAAEVEAPEKYQVLECLGRGGFGAVYKAMDSTLGRHVALKFLSQARPADVERFRREARFAARLNNPSIVQVFELGESGGQPFIAMQYVEGRNLAEAQLDAEGIVRAVRTAADALHHAHQAGVVHRDFKPANVLIDQAGNAFLTDFGIARDVGGPIGATISQDGAVMGTPALMPPEQARGDLRAIDARSDIYAVGATLYYLLCGRYPFEGPHVVDVLHAVIHDDPPMPRSLNPSIPRDIESIIFKCMRKERSRRYQSMAHVVADLDAHLAGRAIDTAPVAWFRTLVGAGKQEPPSGSDTDLFATVGMETVRQIADWDANLYRVSRDITRFFPKLDTLVDRLDAVLTDNPHLAWARFHRGLALFRRGRLAEALDDMECSIDRLADQPDAQFEMGKLYLTMYLREKTQAAKHLIQMGADHQLANARDHIRRAVVCFQETQRLRKGGAPWHVDYACAVCLLDEDDFAACVRACDEILARDPDIEDVWKLRGDAQRLAGQDPFDSYKRATEVRRSFFEAYLAMAGAHLDRMANGTTDETIRNARDCLDQALTIYPGWPDAEALKLRTFLLQGRRLSSTNGDASDTPRARTAFDEGITYAAGLIENHGRSYDITVTLAELHIERGRLLFAHNSPSARTDFDTAIETLANATHLPGCQNRVNYLTCTARLARARTLLIAGQDARTDLDAIMETSKQVLRHCPEDPMWLKLITEASHEMQLTSP